MLQKYVAVEMSVFLSKLFQRKSLAITTLLILK